MSQQLPADRAPRADRTPHADPAPHADRTPHVARAAHSRRRRLASVAIVSAALAISGATALAGSTGVPPGPIGAPLPAIESSPTVSPFATTPVNHSYKVYNAQGKASGTAKWLTTPAGNNCCEDYVTATPGGRLVAFGGTYPMYSDDQGTSWTQVQPITPLENGEGAIVAGPGGDLVGVGWDAYTGDHLQAFKYDGNTQSWQVAEMPLPRELAFDRPWITLAQGPFTLNGQTVPYLFVVRGGTGVKDPQLISTDGLNYTQLSSISLDEQLNAAPVTTTVPVTANPLADYWAPNPGAGTTPLNAGGLLQLTQPNDGDRATCPMSQLSQANTSWSCSSFTAPGVAANQAQIQQDSRGVMTDVTVASDTNSLIAQTSSDGGKTWSPELTLTPPSGGILEGGNEYATAVNGKLGLLMVKSRFDDANGHGQDVVFAVDTRGATPKLIRTYMLGMGDLVTGNNAGSTNARMDYQTIAILPDGKVATSFDDSTTKTAAETTLMAAGGSGASPNLAILQAPVVTGTPGQDAGAGQSTGTPAAPRARARVRHRLTIPRAASTVARAPVAGRAPAA